MDFPSVLSGPAKPGGQLHPPSAVNTEFSLFSHIPSLTAVPHIHTQHNATIRFTLHRILKRVFSVYVQITISVSFRLYSSHSTLPAHYTLRSLTFSLVYSARNLAHTTWPYYFFAKNKSTKQNQAFLRLCSSYFEFSCLCDRTIQLAEFLIIIPVENPRLVKKKIHCKKYNVAYN